MSASKRVDQIAGHLNYPKGMLAGQTAIITGSGQGIGAEAARLFAKEGAKVVVADIDATAAPYFRVKDGEPRNIINISSTSGVHGNAGQINYALAKAGVTGMTKTIAKEWGPQFGVRANTVAFGHIMTRLTAAKEEGAFITTADGEKVALGIPSKQSAAPPGQEHMDIPLRRPGTATEAASAVLAVASPLFSYVNGETIKVTGGRNM
ncbi:3-oxoacyl-(acyl-carrier-) reductase [Pyrenophora seminiperda CCB06]|uniref:3-oxoacyl-(Acyl-carrier-) reductase n=1 Tax=Pyrenophora seminiperda CCB06 TaxID=1302712 RepID=A0A3M7MBF6_9PLEO|nr:3-oxoacyl-(acyl-carrier-) reductase [Pyrenophora seminiperda CCB06]